MNPELLKVYHQDPLVHQGIQLGASFSSIIVAMHQRHTLLLEQLALLQSIAPTKLAVGDTHYVWHCPDDLIPVTTIDL